MEKQRADRHVPRGERLGLLSLSQGLRGLLATPEELGELGGPRRWSALLTPGAGTSGLLNILVVLSDTADVHLVG